MITGKLRIWEKSLGVLLSTAVLLLGMSLTTQANHATASEKIPIVKIVFIDSKEGCDCTKKKITKSWSALTKLIKKQGLKIPIERVHADTDEEKADFYWEKKSFSEIPTLFFLNESGTVVEALQGEVSLKSLQKIFPMRPQSKTKDPAPVRP